jgi:acetone carboxylase gamma subunit
VQTNALERRIIALYSAMIFAPRSQHDDQSWSRTRVLCQQCARQQEVDATLPNLLAIVIWD